MVMESDFPMYLMGWEKESEKKKKEQVNKIETMSNNKAFKSWHCTWKKKFQDMCA